MPRCPQCRTAYTVVQAARGPILYFGDLGNAFANKISPVFGAMALVAGGWASLATYGAVTIYVVCGSAGRALLRQTSPIKLFLWLPAIPLVCYKA